MTASAAEAAPAGDAFDELFRRHFAFVWRSLRHLGIEAAEADDLAQEVFIVAHRNIETIDEPARAWLFAVARRLAANDRRRRTRARRRRDALKAVPRADASDPRTEVLLALESMLKTLPEEQALVLVLRDIEGFKGREIATALELSVDTVFSRLRLARARMERFVAEANGGRT